MPDLYRDMRYTRHMSDERILRVTRSCAIGLDELEWRFSASGGPGGQHANTSNTKAEVRFDIATSPSLTEAQRERLMRKLGNEVIVTASDRRSQLQNRELALERLRTKLGEALKVEAPRVATRPSKAAKTRRLEAKKRRGQIKRSRRSLPPED